MNLIFCYSLKSASLVICFRVVPKNYLIETFGCQMNVHDSERMAGLLEQSGYECTENSQDADIIVINTCSVRDHAESKLYTRLGEIRVMGQKTGHKPIVAIAGCVAQQEGTSLTTGNNGHVVDIVLGTQRQKLLPMMIQKNQLSGLQEVDIRPLDDVTFPLGIARRSDPVKAYVNIIEGCNDHCAFCVVPNTRGHERMRSKADILTEVKEAVDTGRREIHLLGQIVNHYQAPDDQGCDFPELLSLINDISGVERIRFASPHPRHTGKRLIQAIRDLPHLCKHLHLPVQSGSTQILQAMRRRHSREEYLDLIGLLRETVPEIQISTDVIVGFPGESQKDFESTLSLVEQVGYHSMFSFKYSPRPNTLASKRMEDNVSAEEKTARIVNLQSLQKEIQTNLNKKIIGKTVEVLIDAVSHKDKTELSGRTSGNTLVSFHPCGTQKEKLSINDWIGRLAKVDVKRAGPHSLWGEMSAD